MTTKRITLNELKSLIKQIINEDFSNENKYRNLESFMIDNIDLSGYDGYENSRDKLQSVYDIFLSENGYNINRYGKKGAIIEWLRGLPSAISLPYNYSEVENALYSLGFDEIKDMGNDEIDSLYYNSIADIILSSEPKTNYSLNESKSNVKKITLNQLRGLVKQITNK